jgi:hypothetical protein
MANILATSATTDTTNADNIGSGTLAAARVATLNQDTTGSAATLTTARTIGGTSFDGSANIAVALAATATTLATARTIAGVSFDGSANISLNNNAITNGAGYITATLTEEQVEDFVGGMVTGNTETGITVTYQDADGTLDFVVATQTDNNFTTTLKNKLDGIAAGATNVSNTNQLTNGAGFITATLTEEQVEDYVGGMVTGNTETGITVTYQDADGTLDFVVASQTDNNFTTTLKNKLDGIAASATNVTNNNQLTNGAGYITATLTEEQVEDYVGGMVTGNTETGITVTYQDSDGTLDFAVASQTDNNFTTTLKNKLDGIAASATNVTNNNQLTNGAGYITSAPDPFPSGTRMIFQQTSAPSGWTKDTSDTNQRALRVVSGTAGSGGSVAFTTAFASNRGTSSNNGGNTNSTNGGNTNSTNGGNTGSTSGTSGNRSLSSANNGSHYHEYVHTASGSPFGYVGGTYTYHLRSSSNYPQPRAKTSTEGSGSNHNHSFPSHNHSTPNHSHTTPNHSHTTPNHSHTSNIAVQYLDVIIASKN